MTINDPLKPSERRLDYRPEGRWGPSYVGVVDYLRSSLGDDVFTCKFETGALKRRWPLGRRIIWLLRGRRA